MAVNAASQGVIRGYLRTSFYERALVSSLCDAACYKGVEFLRSPWNLGIVCLLFQACG
jgi:hypothetical protein